MVVTHKMQLHNKYVLNSEFKDIMINNKTKLFLLFTVIFVAMIGISSISAADADSDVVSVEDTSNNIADVQTTTNSNNINNMEKTDYNSNSNVISDQSVKTLEKENKNVKQYRGQIIANLSTPKTNYVVGENIDVTLKLTAEGESSHDFGEIVHCDNQVNLGSLKKSFDIEGTGGVNPTYTTSFSTSSLIEGTYDIKLTSLEIFSDAGEVFLEDCQTNIVTITLTSNTPTPSNPNIAVNGVSYTKKQNKVITEANTNVTVVVSNEGGVCDEANVILTIGDESQTKTITNLQAGTTQNLVYGYNFKSPGTKTVKVVVDYLNGTTVEAYSGNVKVEIYYTTVSSELLTTKATGTVTGGLYHNAIQNPSFDSSLNRKFQSDVTFNFADDYSNVTTARLYAVLYDSRDEHPTYSINLTMDGNNDGEYETTLENNHYIGVATTADSTVYKINDNITKVYTDYVLFYDVTNYINSNTVNVELNSSYGAIKCIGLIVAYNQDNSGKEVKYWINLGTVWSNSDVSTTFATRNNQADDVNLTQSIASSSNPTTTFNGNTLTYTKNPSGYFGIESWNVTDKYSSSSNMQLKNTASGSFKTMAATLSLTSNTPATSNPNIEVTSVSYTKKQNKVITEANTNVTVVVSNDGGVCDEANVILTIGDESQTKTITNLQAGTTQNLVYGYNFKSPGTKTVKVVVDYLNGTTVEAYSGNVKVEIYYTTVSSELLTTKATGTVTGGLYHNAIQNPSFDSSLNRKFQSDVTFNFADDYSNVTTARLYAVLYDSRDEHPTYSINLTMDGNNDGEYETTLENNHYIGVATTADSTVYKINDNITKVYTDYVLFYDVTNYINSNTVNVELNSSYGAIKCIGLIVAYNQDNSGKEVKYWINLGTVWSNSDVSTTFATRNNQADDVNLTQSIASSSNPTTTFNGNTLTYTKNPSGYFGIESWNVTDKYSSSSNMQLKNTASGSFKTMAATLALTTTLPTNVIVDSVSFTKTQNAVLVYNDTNVTVVVSTEGAVCDEADITLTIGDESQTKTVTNIGNTPQNVVFEEYFTDAGLKDVSVVITYSNGTSVTAYTGNVNIIASGYMGKSFSNGTNMTNKVTYDGYNTLNVYGNLFDYKSNQPVSFTFDANSKGLDDENKVVDVFYYQPWGVWNGQIANITVSLNGEELNYMSSYKDQKGFGGYDFPYGLYVYNITDKLSLSEVNNFNIAPVSGAAGYAYFYGGYIVAIYANSTNRSVISIAEDCDALSAGTSSSYGATPETAITYANFDGIDTTDVSNAYVTVMANNANNQEYLYMNDNQKALLKDSYNYGSQVAIATADVTGDIAADNVVAIKCVQDTSVYVLTSILVVEYEEPIKQIDVTVAADSVAIKDMATITLTFNDTLSDGKVEVFIGDEEEPVTTITEFDSNVITIENIDTSNYNIGENTITVKYSDSSKYEDLTENAILTLTSRQVSLTAEPLSITKDLSSFDLTVTFNDTLSDGIINVYSNNKVIGTYTISEDCNSVDVTVSASNIPLGESELRIDYSDSQLYDDATTTTQITNAKSNTSITIDPVILNANKTATITAKVTAVGSDSIVNEGKVVFKLNGKTLKDENGKVIYVKVVDGVASIEYSFANLSSFDNLNITATYSGSSIYNSSKSESVQVQKPEDISSTVITVDDITAKSGDVITINATIKDLGGNNLQSGKVVFKINGKTVKDTNGKVVYANIVDGKVSIEYDTSSLKVRNYTISVIMVANNFYPRNDANATLNIEE